MNNKNLTIQLLTSTENKEKVDNNNNYRYILYGASFNPPHMGHFYAIQQMLEKYDRVIVFPYPHKHETGSIEKILPLKHRLEMLKLFINEFFPKIANRLIVRNLAGETKQRDRNHEGVLHTYDYLLFLKKELKSTDTLHACLGLQDKQNENFYNRELIEKNFGFFFLEDETVYRSKNIRDLFGNKIINKQKIINSVGVASAEYIIKNNLYGINKTKLAKSPYRKGFGPKSR